MAQEFLSTPGASTWTCPEGVYFVVADCIGGGGGAINAGVQGGGGGGGGFGSRFFYVSPGNEYDFSVGAGGTPGSDGGDTWFHTEELCKGAGGSGNDELVGGTGGGGSGSVVYTGGTGGGNEGFSSNGGGGGSSASWAGNGSDGTDGSLVGPGAGGIAPDGGGNGGTGGEGFGGFGVNGFSPGGGGGGNAGDGGETTGGNGLIRLTYTPGVTSLPNGGFSMYGKTKNLVISKACAELMLESAGDATPTFTMVGAKVQLFKNDVTVNRGTLIGELTEAEFTGYAEKTLTAIGGAEPALHGPVNLNSTQQGLSCSLTWECTADLVDPGETIFGYMVLNPAGDTLWMSEKFETPFPVANDGDFIQLDVIIPQPNTIAIP